MVEHANERGALAVANSVENLVDFVRMTDLEKLNVINKNEIVKQAVDEKTIIKLTGKI